MDVRKFWKLGTCSEVVDDVGGIISWSEGLRGNENHVHQVSDEEESKRGELQHACRHMIQLSK